jgi:hypothetical protein
MITKGWIMGRNGKSIWITNNSKKIIFDMMIPTTTNRVFLFAMYFSRDMKMTNIANNNVGTISLEGGEGRKNVDFASEGVTEIDFESKIESETVNGNNYDETVDKGEDVKEAKEYMMNQFN